MRVAVTGSSGFIGTHLVPLLKGKGHIVVEISRRNGINLEDWHQIKDIQECDVIVHLAAKTFVPDSFIQPYEFYNANIKLTLNAVELARLWKAKIIHISSYLYGPPQYLPVDEIHPIHPHNPYAQTKMIAENIVQGYARDFNLMGLMFRVFNIYGPNQDFSFLIPTILNQVKAGRVILKDPRPKRDFIHVYDVASAIVKATEIDFNEMEIVNLGSGKSYSVKEIVDIFQKSSPIPFEVEYTNEYRHGEVLDSVSDNTKLAKLLHWNPEWSLDQGISELILKEKK